MRISKLVSMRYLVFGVILAVTVFVVQVAPNIQAFAANTPDDGAKVSFTFDDGLSSALLAAQTLQPFGYSGTDYVITHCVGMIASSSTNDCLADTNVNYMSWSDIATLHSTYGWEIGSHTVTHPLTAAIDNPTLTDQGLDYEMSHSQAVLQAHGYQASDFASPYGDYDNRSLSVIAKYYASHRTFQDYTYSTDPVSNTFPYYAPRSSYPYNNYLLTVLPVEGDVPVQTVENAIDTAQANHQWLILVFHNIKADGDPSYDPGKSAYEYRAGDLAKIAAYVHNKALPVVRISDGLASGTNLMPNSSFNDGITDGWKTDSTTAFKADQQLSTFAGHGSYDGTANGPWNSISLSGSATTAHLFSPKVPVLPGTIYTIKNFVNLSSTSGEVDFYIDEYDAAGNDLKSGKYYAGVVGSPDANAVQVGDVNFMYTPSSSQVQSARLQVIALGPSLRGYLDNSEWLSPNGAPTPPVVTPPTPSIPGDLNNDGLVNALDLSTVLTNWNKTGQTKASGDLNGDGVVNAIDLSMILTNWSK